MVNARCSNLDRTQVAGVVVLQIVVKGAVICGRGEDRPG